MTDASTEGGREQAGGGQGASKDEHAANDRAASTGVSSAPAEVIEGIGAALRNAVETKPTSTAETSVSAAFALGWHMSELYARHLPANKRKPLDLPGLSDLRKQQPLVLVVDQVLVGVKALENLVSKAGLGPIDLTSVKALSETNADRDLVLEAHTQLLTRLTAADPRIGKAYGLGRALADSCREPGDLAGLKKEMSPYRIANLLQWLDDLSSALPSHAAHSVATSLGRWRDALYPPDGERVEISWNPLNTWRSWRERRRRPKQLDIADPEKVDEAVKALRRQGELWRALLSGEKRGQDMLEVDNYLDAGRQLMSQTAVIVRGLVKRMPILAIAVVVLVGGGIWLLSKGKSGHVVAGATSVLAGLGLTWKGLGSVLGELAGKLEQPLWGAALDDAIADAITLLPGNKAEAGGRREVAWSLATGPEAADQNSTTARVHRRPKPDLPASEHPRKD